jgi:Ca2+-binding EF-hand superfamily protein
LRGKAPGGLMDSTIRQSTSLSAEGRGLPPRPSTALGLSSSVGGISWTRPSFDALIPPKPEEEWEPLSNETLQAVRKKVYEKAINLRTMFRQFDSDKDGTVSRLEFKKACADMNFHFSDKVMNGIFKKLDKDDSGIVNYEEFAALLKTKDTNGEYNPFLLERTYYEGSAKPEATNKVRDTKLSAKDIDSAYKLHEEISRRLHLKYLNPRTMFRDLDENKNGAISSEEFVEKLKKLNIETSAEEIDRLINVFQTSMPGQLTYKDFVEHFHQPDKWGFCSQFNAALPLGKCGTKVAHPPMDSTTMQKTHWDKQGRREPRELLQKKKEFIKNLVEEGKTIDLEIPTPTIVLRGKTKKGLLDKFLLEELRRKFTVMRKDTRAMFRILDPAKEGRVSRCLHSPVRAHSSLVVFCRISFEYLLHSHVTCL